LTGEGERGGEVEKMDKNMLCKIAEIGRRYYVNEIISQEIHNREILRNDWYEALKFFFRKTFYQGRKDTISTDFLNKSLKSLDNYLGQSVKEKESKLKECEEADEFEEENWERSNLSMNLHNDGVNKRGDRLMVISSLKFTLSLTEFNKNLVNWGIYNIEKGNIAQAYEDINGIWSVGDKTASLFLRDLVSVFELEERLKHSIQDFLFLQPVDTWVRQVSTNIGIISNKDSDMTLKLNTLDICQKCNISPIEFNQGAWFIGARSFELILKLLRRELKI
jgi:hypothetical protein